MKHLLLLILLAVPLAGALETTGEWSIEISKDAAESSSRSKGLFTTVFYNNEPRTMLILPKTYSRFRVNGDWYKIITELKEKLIEYRILLSQEEIINSRLSLGDSTELDLTKDGYNDLKMTFREIRGAMVLIEFENIHKEMPDNETGIKEITLQTDGPEETENISKDITDGNEAIVLDTKKEWKYGRLIAIAVVALAILAAAIRSNIMKKRKKLEERYTYKNV